MSDKYAVIDYEDGTCTIQKGEHQPEGQIGISHSIEPNEDGEPVEQVEYATGVLVMPFGALPVDEVFDTLQEAKDSAESRHLNILNIDEL